MEISFRMDIKRVCTKRTVKARVGTHRRVSRQAAVDEAVGADKV